MISTNSKFLQVATVLAALGTTVDAAGECSNNFDIRINQDRLRHYGTPYSAYYDGKISLTQRITTASAVDPLRPTRYNTQTFEYNATLAINGYIDPITGRFTDLGWSLRAYAPWVAESPDSMQALREVVSLSRYVYPNQETINENGYRDVISQNIQSWSLNVSEVYVPPGADFEAVNLTSTFLENPKELRDPTSPPSDNWISLNGITAPGFNFLGDSTAQVAGNSDSTALATIFLSPPSNSDLDIIADITGVGSSTVTFTIMNGSYVNEVGGGLASEPCYDNYPNITSGLTDDKGQISDFWLPYEVEPSDSSTEFFWNATGEFDIEFVGTVNDTAGRVIVAFENGTSIPVFAGSDASVQTIPRKSTLLVAAAACFWFIIFV